MMDIGTESASIAEEIRRAFAEEAADLIRRLERALAGIAGADKPTREGLWLEAMRVLHTLKGAAAASGAVDVRDEAHSLEDLIRALHAIGEPPTPEFLDRIFASVDHIGRALSRNATEAERGKAHRRATDAPTASLQPAASVPKHQPHPKSAPSPSSEPSRASEPLRIRKEHVESLHHLLGDLVLGGLQREEFSRNVKLFRDRLSAARRSFTELDGCLEREAPALPSSALRMQRRDLHTALRTLDREMTALIREAATLDAQGASVSANLWEAISSLRLSPLAPFFEDFGKVAREAARESGKQITLRIQAEGAEVDRSVLAELREPLFHLVRNAVVHGIESSKERLRIGKQEAGTILLEARCEGTRAVLRIADDGAGIDPRRVFERARQLGHLDGRSGSDAAKLLDVLTLPGFSTREQVCTLAGRGIGLDVVASRVEELGGKLSLDNLPGAGCAFTLDIPIRAAATRGLIVGAAGHRFGLLLAQIDRVLRVGAGDIQVIGHRESVVVDEEPVALVSLAELLELPDGVFDGEKRPALVLRQGRQRLCVLVDTIFDEQLLVIKELARAFRQARAIAGGAVQPDGDIVPVLQAQALVERAARRPPQAQAPKRAALQTTTRTRSILAVDDSMTMRTLLRSLLRASGFEVAVAHDGQDALDQLEQMERCDLIITDLEMPRMDGVSLCRIVRASERHRHIPLLVVTSLGEAEEKRRALAAGADAYLVKAEFEQAAFIETVRRLLGEERVA